MKQQEQSSNYMIIIVRVLYGQLIKLTFDALTIKKIGERRNLFLFLQKIRAVELITRLSRKFESVFI